MSLQTHRLFSATRQKVLDIVSEIKVQDFEDVDSNSDSRLHQDYHTIMSWPGTKLPSAGCPALVLRLGSDLPIPMATSLSTDSFPLDSATPPAQSKPTYQLSP